MKNFEFKCSKCDEIHKGIPSFGSKAPIYYFEIPKLEIESRSVLTSDSCILDDKEFYVRGCLEMPVIGFEGIFSFGSWVSLSKQDYFKFEELYHEEKRDHNEPMFGWFSTWIWTFEETEKLAARIHFRNDGIRPYIELEPTDHPLAICQREGITAEKIKDIYEYYVHGKE